MNGLVIGSDFCPTITVNNTSGVESTGLTDDLYQPVHLIHPAFLFDNDIG